MKYLVPDVVKTIPLLSLVFSISCTHLHAANAQPNLSGTIEYFGHGLDFALYVEAKRTPGKLPDALFESNAADVERAGIPKYLEAASEELGIVNNDFARLLLIVSFVNAIQFEEDTLLRSLAQMVRHRKTSKPSRALLATSICQSMGYDAVAVVDDNNEYHFSVSFCRDERTDSMATNASFRHEGRIFYLIDLSLRSPAGILQKEPGSSFKIVGERKALSCISSFSDSCRLPSLPPDSIRDREVSFFLNHNNVNYDISLRLKANLRDYVNTLPLALPLFFCFAKDEMAETGCMEGLLSHMKGLRTEQQKVNFLLAVAQDSALCIYLESPIKPTTVALFEAQADCDTRSQILAGLLLNAGFARILVLATEKHLALALAPEEEATIIPGGKYIHHKERKYYFLDPAIINGKWGTAVESGTWRILMDLEDWYGQKK